MGYKQSTFLNNTQIKEAWDDTSLFMSQEFLEKDKLPSIVDLLAYTRGRFSEGIWEQPIDVDISASIVSREAGFQQQLGIQKSNIQQFYSSGFTLCFGDMSDQIQPLTDLKSHAVNIFGSNELLSVTAYLSPPNSVGVLHFDRQHNFFLQREGTKRWYVSKTPAIKNPYENFVFPSATQNFIDELHGRGYEIAMPKDCGKSEYFLKPGDVLYVPPGFYHSPETGEAPSLHYTLTVEPNCIWKDMNKNIFTILLKNCSDLNKDYRFLSREEKESLLLRCRNIIHSAELLPEIID